MEQAGAFTKKTVSIRNYGFMAFSKAKKHARLGYGLLLGGAALWCAAILIAPAVKAHSPAGEAWIRFFFRRVCHQNPDRSFSMANGTLPVCARCAGIYAGFLLGTVLYPVFRKRTGRDFSWRLWLILAAGAGMAEWVISSLLPIPNLWPRAATGLFLGGLIAPCTLSGLHDLLNRTRKGRIIQ